MKPYQLDKNYRITADPNAFVLQELQSKGKEGMQWVSIEWHVSIGTLLKSFMSRYVRESKKDMHHAIQDSVRLVEGASRTLEASLRVDF